MQLCKAKALGMLDDHDGRLRHVDTHFDDRRCDEKLCLVGGKSRHRRILLHAFQTAMDKINPLAEFLAKFLKTCLRRCKIGFFGFIDQRADPVGAFALHKDAPDRILDLLKARQRNGAGVDRLSTWRLFAQLGNVHVAEESKNQRTLQLALTGDAMIERSRTPVRASCSVRGIGVAVSVSTCTSERNALSFSLWATPKCCSSSTTSKARSLNFIFLPSRAWVPITMSTLPTARPDLTLFSSGVGTNLEA